MQQLYIIVRKLSTIWFAGCSGICYHMLHAMYWLGVGVSSWAFAHYWRRYDNMLEERAGG